MLFKVIIFKIDGHQRRRAIPGGKKSSLVKSAPFITEGGSDTKL